MEDNDYKYIIAFALKLRLKYLNLLGRLKPDEYDYLQSMLNSNDVTNISLVDAQTIRHIVNEISSENGAINATCTYGGGGDSGEIFDVNIECGSNYDSISYDMIKTELKSMLDCPARIKTLTFWDYAISCRYGGWGNDNGCTGDGYINIFTLSLRFEHDWIVESFENESDIIDLSTIKIKNL